MISEVSPTEIISRLEQTEAYNQELSQENKLLREEIRLLKYRLFGPKSERVIGPDQPALFEPEEEVESCNTPPKEIKVESHKRKVKHPGRHALPENLPREIVEIPLKEEERECSCCGSQKTIIGYETTEELEVIPAKLFVREYRREKTACRKCHGEVTTAEGPTRPIEKGIAGPGLLAQIIVDKYVYHIPLYRQEKRFSHQGIRLVRNTLCGWLKQLHPSLKRIVNAQRLDLLAGGYIQADETPTPMQDRTKIGKHHKSYFWVYNRPKGPVVFNFQCGRSRDGPKAFLEDFEGTLQHDGFAAYYKIGKKIVHVACLAHIRRKFYEAYKAGHAQAYKVILAIKRIYAIERFAREQQLSSEDRMALREKRLAWRMRILHQRIKRLALDTPLPNDQIMKACKYALNHWHEMYNVLKDGRVEIDNNLVENAIRPIALGRKNWMQIGSPDGGEWAATYASLVQSCIKADINPFDYLKDVIARIAEHPANKVHELMPHCWKPIEKS